MGWETLAIAGFQGLQAMNTMNQGESAAKAAVKQAGYQTQQVADNTVRTAGSLQTSFLQSGITLAGGPMDVLAQAFAKGQTDIGRIAANANATSKNDINAARSKALEGLMSSAAGASSSFFGAADNFGSDVSSGLTSMNNGTGFGLGYQASQDFRKFGGGFGPGEFN